jgi:ferredoxin like protein
MGKISLDNKLGLDRFHIDQHNPHITINDDYDNEEKINLLVMACPAGLYSYENGKISFNHEGCLECGTCRVLSKGKVIKSWNYPMGGKGIEFIQG